MQLILAIAALCSVAPSTGDRGFSDYSPADVYAAQVTCQQSYLHCVNVKKITLSIEDALEKCIMEKK